MEVPVQLVHENHDILVTALIDSGAGASCINVHFARQNKLPLHKLSKPIPVSNVDGTPNIGGEITHAVHLTTKIAGRTSKLELLVTTLGRIDILLGYVWLETENPDIDWRKKTIRWRDDTDFNIYTLLKDIGNDEPEPEDLSLVISFINEELTDEAKEIWGTNKMSHSQMFAAKAERAKEKTC
jgi:hypothetical protein